MIGCDTGDKKSNMRPLTRNLYDGTIPFIGNRFSIMAFNVKPFIGFSVGMDVGSSETPLPDG